MVTAKGWYWQTLHEIGCQCCQILCYYSGCQPLHCTCSLVYWYTVHAKSVMNHAYVMFCPCPTPIFKMYVSEILYEKESSFYIMLSEMKMIGE